MRTGHNGVVETIERDATFADWVRLFTLFCLQEDLDPFVGPIGRLFAVALGPPLFVYIILRRRRPRIVLARRGRRVLGGFTLSRYGILENAALVNDPVQKRAALRVLIPKVEQIIGRRESESLSLRTVNNAFKNWVLRHGFVETRNDRYLNTADIGVLKFSWISRKRPARLTRRLRSASLKQYRQLTRYRDGLDGEVEAL